MTDILPTALALHRASQLEDAARLYQTQLAAQPDHADALHLLGLLHHEAGRDAEAVELIGGAAPGCRGLSRQSG